MIDTPLPYKKTSSELGIFVEACTPHLQRPGLLGIEDVIRKRENKPIWLSMYMATYLQMQAD